MRILIVQLGRIGDMILATPMFSMIKKHYPDSELNVLASRINYPIIKNNPNVDEIFVLDKAPHKLIPLITRIRSKSFDYLIDAKDHHSTESSIIARIVRANMKIGYNPSKKQYFTVGIDGDEGNKGLHFTMRCLKPLKHLKINPPDSIPRPELYPSEDSVGYVRSFLDDSQDKKIIVINLSASKREKMWDNDKWSVFIRSLDTNYFPVITYAPQDKDIARDLLSRVTVNDFKSRRMDDVIVLIKEADILVTPDTSLVHIAAAYDKPLLGLYSGLDEFYSKFHPLSSVFEVVRAPKGSNGIKEIKAEQVVEGFLALINRLNNK
jgi:ADP-heptose:LPS heptosyltransferase